MKNKHREEDFLYIKPSRAFKHLPRNSVERDRKKMERNKHWEEEDEYLEEAFWKEE